jgi:dTDP-4-dehydrorhamnose reductase
VGDEIGSASYTADLAPALVRLVATAPAGTYHLVGSGIASRFEIAREVIASCRPLVRVTPISRGEYPRASTAPAWAVLDAGRARSFGISLRPWQTALGSYLKVLCATGAPR